MLTKICYIKYDIVRRSIKNSKKDNTIKNPKKLKQINKNLLTQGGKVKYIPQPQYLWDIVNLITHKILNFKKILIYLR